MSIIFYTVIFFFVTPLSSTYNLEYNILLEKLISSIETVTNFYANNLINFNVDGIFGLQILQGEISNVLMGMEYKLSTLLKETSLIDILINGNASFIQRLSFLRHNARDLSEKARSHLKLNYQDYYEQMKYFVNNEWMPQIRFRSVGEVITETKDYDSPLFNENTSDQCLSEITKYIGNDISSTNVCNISKTCLNVLLLQKGLSNYLVTHQVLYSTLIQKSNCLYHINEIIRSNDTSIDELQSYFCSRIHNENKRLYTMTSVGTLSSIVLNIPVLKQDLFLEQIFVCGTIGFMDFVNLAFLPTIMGWVSKSGCFKTQNPVESIETVKGRRSILEEVFMADGCLAHKTSLGLAVLSTYLRLFFNAYIPASFKKEYNALNSIKEERLNFQRRNLPALDADVMSLLDAHVHDKFVDSWEPYFNRPSPDLNRTVVFTKMDKEDHLYLYLVVVAAVLIGLFVFLKKMKKCARYLIK